MSIQPTTAPATDDFWGEPIHVHTREQAIADGQLIDHSDLAREYGIKWPVALTAAAHADLVAWDEAAQQKDMCQDETGRAWDVLTILKFSLQRLCTQAQQDGSARIETHLYRVPATGESVEAEPAPMSLHLGMDEHGAPCLTVMLPSED